MDEISRKHPLLRGGYLLFRRYLQHRVAVQSAALAFYLLFTVFPLLIFISSLLGLLELDVAGILQALEEVLPREVVGLAEVYLLHVGENPSRRLLAFGLVFSIYFPMRATNSLMRSVRTAYHLGPPLSTVRHVLKTLVYTVLLMTVVALTLILMTVGERLLLLAVEWLAVPLAVARAWAWLRFPVVAVAGYFALFFLYALSQDHRQPCRRLWPGTLAALTAWLAVSWLYAFYVDHIAHYSALYGSIGAIIVLMVWLNLSAAILILGAELNGVLGNLQREHAEAGG